MLGGLRFSIVLDSNTPEVGLVLRMILANIRETTDSTQFLRYSDRPQLPTVQLANSNLN